MATMTTLTAILVPMMLANITGTYAAGPVLTAYPDQINLGLTDTLDVNCTLSLAEWPGVAALISLSVSRNSSQAGWVGWSELAIISDFSSGQVNAMAKENITANGWFDRNGSASISLHWTYPTDRQAGLYSCKAEGFDSLGHIVEAITEVQVSAHSPALSDWQDKVIEMDKRMKEMDNKMNAVEDFIMKDINDHMTKIENGIADLVRETKHRNIISDTFQPLFIFRNHTYYISTFPYTDIQDSQSICNLIGGYLVEIDDQKEYLVVTEFLNSTTGFRAAIVSGTDEESEGTWTLLSGKPLPFTDWGTGEPKDGTAQNCLALFSWTKVEWQMVDVSCHGDKPWEDGRILCEVPQILM